MKESGMHLHIGKLYNENTTSDATCLRLPEKKRLYGASLGVSLGALLFGNLPRILLKTVKTGRQRTTAVSHVIQFFSISVQRSIQHDLCQGAST